ncbi:hypothetical protein ACF0H5_010774 [Mactra antiquata]
MLPTVPEIKLLGDVTSQHGLQMPQLPDPGKADDYFDQNEKLDFSVRLGSTLSRGFEVYAGSANKDLKLRLGPPSSLNDSRNHVKSPKSPKDVNFSASPRHQLNRSKSRRGSTSRQSSVTSTYITDKETPLMKVRRIFKTVRIISGVCLALKRYVKACETKTWSFMEMYLHVKEDLNQTVAFNPQSFARVEPERYKLKKLLNIDPNERTPEDVKVILALMRGNKSFQDYPYHVQVQLSRCMTYQSYEARRVIIKQGHRAEAFYILLAGHVIANVEDVNPSDGKKFSKTVKDMGPGDTFGELALIEGGRRTASIVCKTNVELLVILKDDFDIIIRHRLVRQIDEHIKFCKTMTLFQDFPCDELAENPAQFFYHYFKKGDIVVKDSRDSKYIIIVKAGKCKVISSYIEKSKKDKRPMSSKSQKDLDAAFPFYDDLQKIIFKHRQPKTEAEKLKDSLCLGLLTGQIDKTRLADHGPDVQRPKSCITAEQVEKQKSVPPLVKSKTLSSFFDNVSKTRNKSLDTVEALCNDLNTSFWSKRLQYLPKSQRTATAKSRQYSSNRPGTRSTNSFYDVEKYSYVQIAEFKSGTVFGLESLVQKPTLRLSLVSEGAECIFISKRLFLALANIKVLRIVTDMIQTYPTPEFIEEQARNYRKWQKYKTQLVNNVLDRRK